jgi:hypothetical protein
MASMVLEDSTLGVRNTNVNAPLAHGRLGYYQMKVLAQGGS